MPESRKAKEWYPEVLLNKFKKYQQKQYRDAACRPGVRSLIPKLVSNSVGILGTMRTPAITRSGHEHHRRGHFRTKDPVFHL